MVIVLGSVIVRAEALEQALSLSQAHVDRSRTEPGCLSHAVHISNEDPNMLVFVERWETMEALEQHFQVAGSREFINAVAQLATRAPQINLYDSAEIPRH